MYCEDCRYYDDGTGFCVKEGTCYSEEVERAKEYYEELKGDIAREEEYDDE